VKPSSHRTTPNGIESECLRAATLSWEIDGLSRRGTIPSGLFPESKIEVQQGPSFAARLESAFALAFDRGADSVVMVGGDGPPLALSDLNQAFGHLEAHERALVLAPSEDGGVNAIGCSARAERPFRRRNLAELKRLPPASVGSRGSVS
jgi:hypothetical protein